MKIFHLADTHLGYSAYRKVSPDTRLNQREIDVFNVFEEFVDTALNNKPDLIIHAGDLFDSVRPSNRAIAFAVRQLLRISTAKIPMVIISGNHETPRLKETDCIFRVFEHIEGIYPVYQQKLELISLEINSREVVVHALPHIGSEERFREEFEKMNPKKNKVNIAVLHGSLVGLYFGYLTGDFNEIKINGRILTREFDYIALGHFHHHTRIDDRCAYSGSTERYSFSEAGKKKGFLEINVVSDRLITTFRELTTREMLDLGLLNVMNMNMEEVGAAIADRISSFSIIDAVVRLKIEKITKEVYKGLDHTALDELTKKALYFRFNWDIVDDVALGMDYSSQFQGLIREFQDFIDKSIVENLSKERLKEMGSHYLIRAGVKD
jgi:DNA repair exonuclease SbcCD nuclease subunit